MVNVGKMTSEKKQIEISNKNLSEELVFTDKEKDCETCEKQKEVTISLGMETNEEWLKVIQLLNKMTISGEETQYVYNFYNRVFKTKKQPGCAKCMRNIAIHLKNRWNQMNK